MIAKGILDESRYYVKSSRRDLCKVGCYTLDSESARKRQQCKFESIFKNFRSADNFLKFGNLKLEWLVIVNHHVTVNRKCLCYSPPITGREFMSNKQQLQTGEILFC